MFITKLYFGLIFLGLSALVAGLFTSEPPPASKPVIAGNLNEVSLEESQQIAEEYVKSMYQFTNYNGRNLELVEVTPARCAYCWRFTYEFDIHSELQAGTINKAIATVIVQEGIITNVASSTGVE